MSSGDDDYIRRCCLRFLRTRIGQEIAALLGSRRDRRWVFIVGCYNSGTTLLSNILSAHPEVTGIRHEGVSLTSELVRPEDFGWPRMWHRCERELEESLRRTNVKRLRRQWSMAFGRKASICLEKSISNSCRIPFLASAFPSAQFIYIIRNGYAVAEGIRRQTLLKLASSPTYTNGYPIELCAEQWRKSDEVISKSLKHLNHICITYEDLCANPTEQVCRIVDHLDLKPVSASLDNEVWRVHGVTTSVTNRNPEAIGRLSQADIEKIDVVANKLLAKHQYLPLLA